MDNVRATHEYGDLRWRVEVENRLGDLENELKARAEVLPLLRRLLTDLEARVAALEARVKSLETEVETINEYLAQGTEAAANYIRDPKDG